MTTDFRALCAELLEAYEIELDELRFDNRLAKRARAALADGPAVPEGREPASVTGQPSDKEGPKDADLHAMAFSYSQPCYQFEYIPYARAVLARWGCFQPPASVTGQPSDEELLRLAQLYSVVYLLDDGSAIYPPFKEGYNTWDDVMRFARAVLARWGTSNLAEVRSSLGDGPAVPDGREPAAVATQPSDREIEEWADACSEAPLEEMDPEVHGWRRCFTAKEFSETIRAALARWGNPVPAPPADGEVAELVAWLQEEADDYDCIGCADSAAKCNRAAELLQELEQLKGDLE